MEHGRHLPFISGETTELDVYDQLAAEYQIHHDRMAPLVSGYTEEELIEEASRRRLIAIDPNVDEESSSVYGQEADFMERLALRLEQQ